MSTSTKSNDASESSPEPGSASHADVELEFPRQRLISWAVFGTIFGAMLVWKLGTVGVWAGWALIAYGLFRGYQLALTYIHPAGRIIVTDKHVVIPRKVHRPNPYDVRPEEVTAAYLLRRSVPMYHAAPVLVIEMGPRAVLFPRDWFATEADQRRVVQALRPAAVDPVE